MAYISWSFWSATRAPKRAPEARERTQAKMQTLSSGTGKVFTEVVGALTVAESHCSVPGIQALPSRNLEFAEVEVS